MSESLENLRRQIDALDEQLLSLLAKRMELTKKAGIYKQVHGLPALDEVRWQAATKARLEQAQQLGLSHELVKQLYELIHAYTLELEKTLGAK